MTIASHPDRRSEAGRTLQRIRMIHTLIWAVFASAVVAIHSVTWLGELRWALWFSLLVAVEVAVLLANGMQCPLRGFAARYTDSHADKFDIFLPAWLARNTKLVFGTLFAAGELLLLWRWLALQGP